ncbi:hypothetical protein V6N11_024641 [Hibiscus sabdariffa]|uniref:Uncharacterized protein n=1 Tax=Hibiscus sabdariffa TaxID=183260 RepID=A0ABR2QMQ7_9ROSI
MGDMAISMASLALDDGEEELLQVEDGILFPNLPDNYGRNFRQGLKGDSSLMEKSTGDISGRSSSQMDFQMGLVSEGSPMVHPECNKRVQTHDLAVVVSKQPDSTSVSFSSLSAGL